MCKILVYHKATSQRECENEINKIIPKIISIVERIVIYEDYSINRKI